MLEFLKFIECEISNYVQGIGVLWKYHQNVSSFFFIKGTIYKWYIKKESTIYKWYIKKVSLIYFFATSIEMLKGIFLDCGTCIYYSWLWLQIFCKHDLPARI